MRALWMVGGWVCGATVSVCVQEPALAAERVGANVCKTCHESQFESWRNTAHASSLLRLSPRDQQNRVCRSCHSTDARAESTKPIGVECESCHGAGELYAQRYVMRDKVLARHLGLDEINKTTCALCHTEDGPGLVPFEYEKKVLLVRHASRPAPASTPGPSGDRPR